MGNNSFYGRGSQFDVDTSKPFTLVTQWLFNGDGVFAEMRRIYKQNGKVIYNARAPHLEKGPDLEKPCKGAGNSITDDFCGSMNQRFGDTDDHADRGGMKVMGESLERGHVLAVSLWDDVEVSMMWLDSDFPRHLSPKKPGVDRGPCPGGDQSTPTYVRQKFPNAVVKYTNFAVGPLGSTTPGVGAGSPPLKPIKKGDKMYLDKCPEGKGEDTSGRRRTPPTSKPSTRRRRRRSIRRRSSKSRRRRRGSPKSRRRRRGSPKTRRRRR